MVCAATLLQEIADAKSGRASAYDDRIKNPSHASPPAKIVLPLTIAFEGERHCAHPAKAAAYCKELIPEIPKDGSHPRGKCLRSSVDWIDCQSHLIAGVVCRRLKPITHERRANG
jgi:hypothetical protein